MIVRAGGRQSFIEESRRMFNITLVSTRKTRRFARPTAWALGSINE
jgi:hypothetical protein